jgi:hypothetical protein
VADTAPITPRPYVTHAAEDVYDQAPVLVVDSPPGARGKLPTGPLGVPVVVVPSCSLCGDEPTRVVGADCMWCGLPAAPRVAMRA